MSAKGVLMSDLSEIKLDSDFINKLFIIAEKNPPEYDQITLETLKDVADAIEEKVNRLKMCAAHASEKFHELKNQTLNKQMPEGDTVLIIDDLCIITYQLGVLFKNLGYHVTVAKDIYDAVDKYKKLQFDLVVMDLFLPTDKEGIILLEELVKLRGINGASTRIGVMTASSKKEHHDACMEKGADFYVEKTENWQKNLVIAADKNNL